MRLPIAVTVTNLLWGVFGLLLWWGLSIEPASSTVGSEGLVISFFGADSPIMDRAFFSSYGAAEAPAGWMICLLFALGGTYLLYRLGNGLFALDRFSAKVRLTLFSLCFVFILLDINPLLSAFLSHVPANLEVLALECGRSGTSLAAIAAGLGTALIVSTLLAQRLDRFDAACAAALRGPVIPIIACSLACAFVIWVRADRLDGLASVSDELSYLRQAEIFAKGGLSEPSFEPKAFFESEQMLNDDRYYSKYPPGTAFCLCPAVWLGMSQAMPVLFLGLNLLLTWLLCRRLFGTPTAHLALLLASVSPFFLSMGESFLSHGPGLCFCLLTFYFQAIWLDTGRHRHAFASGLAAGIFLLIRPVSAVAVLAPLIMLSLARKRLKLPSRLVGLSLFGVGVAIFVAVLLAYNHAQTGDALLNPYEKYAEIYSPYDQFGLQNAEQGGINTLFNLSRLNCWLFGFAPSLLLLLPLFVLGAATAWEVVFLLSLAALALAYLFHWFWGIPWYGPLYYYECAGFCIILAARSLIRTSDKLQQITADGRLNLRLAGLAVLLFAVPAFLDSQLRSVSNRVQQIWGPVLDVRAGEPEPGSWIIVEDEPPGFRAGYLGASPEFLTGGFRILTPKGGSPQRLKQLHPEKRIFRLKNSKLVEVLPEQ